jgi:adenylate cyclase
MKHSLKYILYAIISWVIALNLLMLFHYFGHNEIDVEWKIELIGATISAVVLGLIFSIIDIYINKTNLRQKSFVFIVLLKSLVFLLAILSAIIATVFCVDLIRGDTSIDSGINLLLDAISSKETLLYIFYTILISILFYYHQQVTKKIGPRILINLLLGSYHKPKKEHRIFMFLDLTSATTTAEKLGAFKYSLFLKDFFFDIDDSINEAKGTASQFVGDEVVIVWNERDGIENNNCIRLFFLAEDKIRKSKNRYVEKYGLSPEFKAGVHSGEVIITEVGGTKQEIAYHGDTVNTTARIRSECSVLNEKLLISSELLSLLADIDIEFLVKSKGEFSLKGKENVVRLFNIEQKKLSDDLDLSQNGMLPS